MRKSFLLFVVFVFMSACVSLTREGQMVDIVSNRSDVKGCDFKSLVRSYSAWGGWAASGTGRRNVIIDLKNKVAELGGNVLFVQHLASGAHVTGVDMDGKAYFCDEEWFKN